MRIAIVSDIHGNLTAFEAVLADLRETAPDLILHGGDLALNGSGPSVVADRIRDLNWPGVLGNTDELLFDPDSLSNFAARTPHLKPLLSRLEVLLAAGDSSRMGLPKQLKPLLRHAAESALASACQRGIVVLGARAERLSKALDRLPVTIVETRN